MVPRPLARLRLVYGEPVEVPRAASDAEVDALAARLGETLEALTERAEAAFRDGT
jgi:hypothetical protein